MHAEDTGTRDKVIENVGLPSRARYNLMVSEAVDQTKAGGNAEVGQVWAMLALAEATLLAEPQAVEVVQIN